jgi:hypothetical protein
VLIRLSLRYEIDGALREGGIVGDIITARNTHS